ncbi:MAG: 16S rRNA (cytosine(1402)-N(4))-methyltransferase RsmH [Dysgonamonadaceae bacterium]|jgi:16S rRNA (cytosine1402-N4)-methyltransferase|nr:16S rRNA (cytosine(1402)-N(4))-methyltransferase RsmH [Dysgonamonadaceae bacterium]
MDVYSYHIPVLVKESVDGLNIQPKGKYVDNTYGGGGHANEILKRLDDDGRLYAFDQDADAEKNILSDRRLIFIRSNFRYFSNFMDWHGLEKIDGVFADLGVSSHHFDDATRGFSFRFDGDLDMRMNKRAGKTAAEILNEYSESELADVFYLYGELRNSRAIARAVVNKRNEKKIRTVSDFLDILKPCFSREKEKKHLAQVFQALRIEVNKEMDALKEMLIQAGDYLKTGGRFVVITYHSLEDRIVKNFFKTGNFNGEAEKDFYGNINAPFQMINSKAITPGIDEIEKNPRSRSAKLRIGEKRH